LTGDNESRSDRVGGSEPSVAECFRDGRGHENLVQTEGGRENEKELDTDQNLACRPAAAAQGAKGWEDMPARLANAELTDPAAIAAQVTPAIAETVRKQVEAGIDCIGDGEF
jgi:hypothetical protein